MKSLSLQFKNRPSSRENGTTQSRRAFPQIDHHFQAVADAPAKARTVEPTATPAMQAAEVRSFRQLSRNAVGSQSHWPFALEATILGLIVATVAWPLLSFVNLISVNPFPW